MRLSPRLLTLLLAVFAAGRALATLPAVTTPLADRSFSPGGAAVTVDLRAHFGLPGVTGQVVQFDTDFGKFNVELNATAAPVTVTNFLSYVNAGSYTNSFFHRSVPGFVIQGGGFAVNATPQIYSIPTSAPIALESSLANVRGTIAMARTDTPNSATSQWFFNTVDNSQMLQPGTSGGYAVFGRVLGSGMSVVDAIAVLPVYSVPNIPVYYPSLGQSYYTNFDELPVHGLQSGQTALTFDNLVEVKRTDVVPVHPTTTSVRSVLTFSVQSSAPGVVAAALNGSDLVLTPGGATGAATITVTATDTNGNTVTGTLTASINKLAQTIDFAAPSDQPFGLAPIGLSATASSGLPVTFTLLEGPATLDGATLTVLAPGTIRVRATQAGDATYAAAPAALAIFTVTPNFTSWQVENFSPAELEDPAIGGPQAVLAGDGLTNLLKYALGLDPRLPANGALPLPACTTEEWTFTYVRPPDRPDIAYTVLVSTDLATWSDTGVTHELVGPVDDWEQWRARVPLSVGAKVFFRLRVEALAAP